MLSAIKKAIQLDLPDAKTGLRASPVRR